MHNSYLKKSIFLIGGSFVLFLSVSAQKQSGQVSQVSVGTVASVSAGSDIVAKELHDPVMGKVLDPLWGSKPSILLRIDLSMRAIRNAFAHIQERKASGQVYSPESDKEFIEKEMAIILHPVEGFFGDIVAVADIIKPLLSESLVGPGQPEESILLMQYFSLKEKDLAKFCERTIKSIDSFERICREFIQLFVDLKKSLSPTTKAAYSAYLVKFKEEQAQMQREKAAQQKVVAR
ncbi:MAG: hypothetical protein ABH827_01960 [bacterium]